MLRDSPKRFQMSLKTRECTGKYGVKDRMMHPKGWNTSESGLKFRISLHIYCLRVNGAWNACAWAIGRGCITKYTRVKTQRTHAQETEATLAHSAN